MNPTSTFIFLTGLSVAGASLVSSCSTTEIAPGEGGHAFEISQSPTATQQANVSFSLAADADTWDEQQRLANMEAPLYNLKIDGRWAVMVDPEGNRYPLQFWAGGNGIATGNWIPAGSHVFEMVETNGTIALTTPATDTQPGQANHLVMFGPRDALEHRVLSYSLDVPAGVARYSVINLVRSGEKLQVLACDAPGSDTCATPVSDPVAYGEIAGGDVAAQPGTLAYRLIPANADAPVGAAYPLSWDILAAQLHLSATPALDPPIFVGAPSMVTSGNVSISLY